MIQFIKKSFGHLKNIFIHKYWVFHYCRKFGITWRGIVHDLSKFNPIEFFESVKYYRGTESPIPVCKKANGVSKAWQHHKGRNPHHYEYWTDNYDGGNPTYHPIPYKYVMEMLADWFAAGKTYAIRQGKDFKISDEYNWWVEKKKTNPAINKRTIEFIDMFMDDAKFFSPDMSWVKDRHNQKVLKNRLTDLYAKDLNK